MDNNHTEIHKNNKDINTAEKIIIVSDIDGTFLGDGERLLKQNYEAIKRFKANGGLFTFATGRLSIDDKLIGGYRELVNAPLIVSNGAVMKTADSGEILYCFPMDGIHTYHILKDICMRYPSVHTRYSCKKGIIYVNWNESPEEIEAEWYKVVLEGESDTLDEIRGLVYQKCGDHFAYSKSCPVLLEFLKKDITKGYMLECMREHYAKMGYRLTVYAIGDYENDLDMLRHADIAVCPSNAMEPIKAECNLIVRSNNEGAIAGLVEWIEQNAHREKTT